MSTINNTRTFDPAWAENPDLDDTQAHRAPLVAPYKEFTDKLARVRHDICRGGHGSLSGSEYGTVEALERFCAWLTARGWA